MNSFGQSRRKLKLGEDLSIKDHSRQLNIEVEELEEETKEKLNNKVVKKMKTMVNDEEEGNLLDKFLGLVALLAFATALGLNINNSIGLRGTIGLFVIGIVASVAYLNRKKLDS